MDVSFSAKPALKGSDLKKAAEALPVRQTDEAAYKLAHGISEGTNAAVKTAKKAITDTINVFA